MRRLALLLGLVGMLVALLAPAATATTPSCTIRWGSLPKQAPDYTAGPLFNVRVGQHACYDRLVIDVTGRTAPGYRVAYVPAVTQDGSGEVVPLRGGAFLQVTVNAPAYNERGGVTLPIPPDEELANVRGFRTFREVAWAGSFEGRTTIGLGVRARLPFRVFTLSGPGDQTRLVLDVAHHW
jgi:hypothetical protein